MMQAFRRLDYYDIVSQNYEYRFKMFSSYRRLNRIQFFETRFKIWLLFPILYEVWGTKKIWGLAAVGSGRGWPLWSWEHVPSPTVVAVPNLFDLGQSIMGSRPLKIGAWLTRRNTPLPATKRGRFRSNATSVITEIRRKILTYHVSPYTVTQGHRNRHGSFGYLWLPISDP